MINLNDYEMFRKYRTTLKELSRDNRDAGNDQYMTESQIEAIDFDKVKTIYTNQFGLSEECATSADALLQSEQELMMVESTSEPVEKAYRTGCTIERSNQFHFASKRKRGIDSLRFGAI